MPIQTSRLQRSYRKDLLKIQITKKLGISRANQLNNPSWLHNPRNWDAWLFPFPWKLLFKTAHVHTLRVWNVNGMIFPGEHRSWILCCRKVRSYQRWSFNSDGNGARSPIFLACLYLTAWTYLFRVFPKAFRPAAFFISHLLYPSNFARHVWIRCIQLNYKPVPAENNDVHWAGSIFKNIASRFSGFINNSVLLCRATMHCAYRTKGSPAVLVNII